MQKPFLKWVGGKHKLLTHIINKLPNKINSYHDSFVLILIMIVKINRGFLCQYLEIVTQG